MQNLYDVNNRNCGHICGLINSKFRKWSTPYHYFPSYCSHWDFSHMQVVSNKYIWKNIDISHFAGSLYTYLVCSNERMFRSFVTSGALDNNIKTWSWCVYIFHCMERENSLYCFYFIVFALSSRPKLSNSSSLKFNLKSWQSDKCIYCLPVFIRYIYLAPPLSLSIYIDCIYTYI